MSRRLVLSCVLFGLLFCRAAHSREAPEKMPREDVVEVPAIGKGLCVSNAFQTNMVIQRDKPVMVWGWADPDEKVSVEFAGKKAEAEAGKDRAWRVTLEAMPANATPQTMTVKGAKETLTLENILVGDVWVLDCARPDTRHNSRYINNLRIDSLQTSPNLTIPGRG